MNVINDLKVCREMKNLYRSLGIDLTDLSPDRPWTPDGDRHLIEMYEHGWTIDAMAAEVKRDEANIAGRILYLGERDRIRPEMWGVPGEESGAPGTAGCGRGGDGLMKAITLWQPWASLMATGAKRFETRSWSTSFRGLVAIHAAKKSFDTNPYLDRELHPFASALDLPDIYSFDSLPTGCIIATAELVNCWRIVYHPGTNVDIARHIPIGAESMTTDKHAPDFADYFVPTELEMLFGDWTPGRYAWEFTNMTILPQPIPAKGAQGLWNWQPPDGWEER